jgi:hypothetical protein
MFIMEVLFNNFPSTNPLFPKSFSAPGKGIEQMPAMKAA